MLKGLIIFFLVRAVRKDSQSLHCIATAGLLIFQNTQGRSRMD